MTKAVDIANYFLNKDPERKYFNKKLTEKNGRLFYDGNARLNKYLHISQNLYIAKTGEPLFADVLFAYDNGAVVANVQENYAILLTKHEKPVLPNEVMEFLDKVFILLEDATLDELIEISHEDEAWEEKHSFHYKEQQKMNSMAYADQYRVKYHDALRLMEEL